MGRFTSIALDGNDSRDFHRVLKSSGKLGSCGAFDL